MTRNNSDTYNGYTARDVKEQASGVAQTAVATVQSGLSKTQDLLYTGLDVAQEQLKRGKKQSRRSLNKAQKRLNKAQKKIGRLQQSAQDKVQSTLPVTRGLIGAALGIAQVLLGRNLRRGKKNLKNIQGTVGESVQSGLSVAQDVLDKRTKQASKSLRKGTKQASKSLKKVTENVKDVQETLQGRLESYQRRRARAKALFRIGLVAGIVAALLYTPWPGAETRSRLGGYLQQFVKQTQNLMERYTS